MSDPNLPENLPTVNIGDRVGRGWRPVGVGEPVKSHYQYFAFHTTPPGWKLGSFMTNERIVNSGVANYRRATSLRSWMSLLFPLISKYYRHFKGKVFPATPLA